MILRIITHIGPWILPPIIGILIGYITNAIAIRMLFRPLREIRVFGVRLPLTPGVIPRQRDVLATSIGRMVSRELITVGALRTQLESEKFRRGFTKNIEALTTSILEKPIESFSLNNRTLIMGALERFVAESLFRFFNSRSFIYTARDLISRLVQHASGKKVGELFAAVDIASFIEKHLMQIIQNEDTRKSLVRFFSGWIAEQRETEKCLEHYVPQEFVVGVMNIFRAMYPQLKESIFKWVRDHSTQKDLEVRAKFLLRDILDKLNFFQKLLVTAGQYDRTLEEKMPGIIADALDTLEDALEDEKNKEKLTNTLGEALEELRQKKIGDVIQVPHEEIPQKLDSSFRKLTKILVDNGFDKRVGRFVEAIVSRNHDKTVQEILSRYLNIGNNDIVDFASHHILNYLSQNRTAESISNEIVSLIGSFFEDRKMQNLKEIFRIDEERKIKIDVFVSGKIIDVVDRKLPDLIKSFDVQELVVQKINSLNVEEVERLLLQVIAKHLKWINVFGGILGGIIGLSQLVLRLFQ